MSFCCKIVAEFLVLSKQSINHLMKESIQITAICRAASLTQFTHHQLLNGLSLNFPHQIDHISVQFCSSVREHRNHRGRHFKHLLSIPSSSGVRKLLLAMFPMCLLRPDTVGLGRHS